MGRVARRGLSTDICPGKGGVSSELSTDMFPVGVSVECCHAGGAGSISRPLSLSMPIGPNGVLASAPVALPAVLREA
eukprot:5085316-Pyramimonas_sp.AAC.1